MDKRQQGFSALEGVLVILILVILGGAGWFVWDSNQKTKDSLNRAQQGSSASTGYKAGQKTPEGRIRYESSELGFAFVYPKEWGEVEIKGGRGEEYDGLKYSIVFSKLSSDSDVQYEGQKYAVGQIKSSDYGLIDGGGSGIDFVGPGATSYSEAVESYKEADGKRKSGGEGYSTTVLASGENYLVAADGDCVGAGYYIVGLAKIELKNKIESVGFMYKDNSTDGCITDTVNGVKNMLDEQKAEEITGIVKSVEKL